ncbi:hypothetical protein Vretimale_19688 [Volvox reticuliferus]|uniref:EamA domain-containing protein n=1 Tax=Volvox reticuliferus TaxID=1737510 RepID=A0A8J4GX83_9CHLO|nr:hypothetical protein Vretifemale_848 [Volvox reticuliferus]GIM17175.1 hypothetical protein Vretimale_19688 [Volvox reticuliferus]
MNSLKCLHPTCFVRSPRKTARLVMRRGHCEKTMAMFNRCHMYSLIYNRQASCVAPCRRHHAATRFRRMPIFYRKASPQDIVNVTQAADIMFQHGPDAWNAVAPPNGTPPHNGTHQEINCTLSGLDSMMCIVEDVPDEAEVSTAGSLSLPAEATAVNDGLLATILQNMLLISPFFFWGTSMVVMKSVVPHTTPLVLGALRLLPAGLMLVGWATASGRDQPSTLKAWLWVLAFALIDGAAFQGFLAEGLTKTSAGLGSVIIDSQPLSVALLASLLFGERLSSVGVAGLMLGVAGLTLLEVPADILVDTTAAVLRGAWEPGLPGINSASLVTNGEFWMLLAAQSMAIGTVMVRYVTRHVDPIMATGWHMIIGGAILAAVAAANGSDVASATAATSPLASLVAQFSHLTAEDAISMLYVSMMGGAVSYGIFFWYASHGSLTSLSSLTFLTPVFASAAGYMALDEVLSPMQLLGAAVTLGAVWCINYRKASSGRPAAAASKDASQAQ